MIGQLTENQIDTILISSVSGRLGCCAEGKPYVVPIGYAYHQACIYSHTREGLKVEMMRQNPNVCFEVDQIDNLANWRSVIVYGTFEELEGEATEEAMQILRSRLAPLQSSVYSLFLWDVQTKRLASQPRAAEVIFRIRISEKSVRFEKSE